MRVTVDRFTDAHDIIRHVEPEQLLATAPHLSAPSLERADDRRHFANVLGTFAKGSPTPAPDGPHEPFLRIVIVPSAAERSAGALTDAALTRIALRVIEATDIDSFDERAWGVIREYEQRIHVLAASCDSAGVPLDLWDVGRRAEAEGYAIAGQLAAEERMLTPDAADSPVWYEPRLVLAADGPLAVHGADARAGRLLGELGLHRVGTDTAVWHRTPFGTDADHCRAVAEHTRRALESAGYAAKIIHLPAATPADRAPAPGRSTDITTRNLGTAVPGAVSALPPPAPTPSSRRGR